MAKASDDLFGRLLAGVEGGEERVSAFSNRPAIFVEGREIAHLDADGSVDVRLTRVEIRRMRAELKADARVVLRSSPSADWLEAVVSSTADEAFVIGLLRTAATANRRR